MPIYEYNCNPCEFKFEEKKGWSDDPLALCPQCGKPAERLFSVPGIIFKGSGFYVTDSKPKRGTLASSTKSSKPKETKKKETKKNKSNDSKS